jgi:hypothetical protein
VKGNAVFEEKKVGNPKEGVEEVEDSEASARDGTCRDLEGTSKFGERVEAQRRAESSNSCCTPTGDGDC